MNPLTNIPPAVRTVLYVLGWVVGTLSGGVAAVWGAIAAASPDVTMPLWLVITAAALQFLAAQLNLVASVNVPSYEDVVEGEAAPPNGLYRNERGAGEFAFLLRVVGLVLLVLLIVWLLGVLF